MQYSLTDTSVVQINESSGVIQNIGQYDIEISDSEEFTDKIVLRAGQEIPFEVQLYMKVREKIPHTVKVNVAPFFFSGRLIMSAATIPLQLKYGGFTEKLNDELSVSMKKNGLWLQSERGYYIDIGGSWSVDFFIKSNGEIKEFTEKPAIHFMLIDSNDNLISLSASQQFKTGEQPSESFYVGLVDKSSYYFNQLDVTLLDGLKHHVYLEIIRIKNTKTTIIFLCIDGTPQIERAFSLDIDGISQIIFGADTFMENVSDENLAIFDEIRISKGTHYFTGTIVTDGQLPALGESLEEILKLEDTLIRSKNRDLNVYATFETES